MTLLQIFESATNGVVTTNAKGTKPDAWILPIIFDPKIKNSWVGALKKLEVPWADAFLKRAESLKFKPKKKGVLAFDFEGSQRIVVGFWAKGTAFETLGWARSCIRALGGSKAKSVELDLRNVTEPLVVDSLISAFTVSRYRGPRYGKKAKAPLPRNLNVLTAGKDLEAEIKRAFESGRATNTVRYLTETAGNDLTPTRLRDLSLSLGKESNMKATFFGKKELEKKSAGAFLAVVQGTEEPGVGIVKVSYRPKVAGRRIALVGKGVTFDTGGNNLKTGEYMLGMNGDMGGSATVLGLLLLARACNWPIAIDGYVTVAENVIGPTSYRPNDVVTSMNGKTIEVIDTDAEGRMLLADTLAFASSENPELILDFATLTGACVRAIGTIYSGAFTNKRRFFSKVIKAGVQSGERVWPFPNDEDYGDVLKSDIADIKQCKPTRGSDHIEASHFLRQFVGKVPWVHIDLSGNENEGGLAHVPSKLTGFGVRFSRRFLEIALDLKLPL